MRIFAEFENMDTTVKGRLQVSDQSASLARKIESPGGDKETIQIDHIEKIVQNEDGV